MKCFKGFDKDLKCRDFQYEIGKEYTEEKADICNCGFHACEFPMDVFNYYPPSDSRYCEVELEANNQKSSDDSKRVGKKISVKAEIGIAGIIKAGVEYIKEQVNWEDDKATNTGYQSAATNTGYRSAATNTGDQSAATNTGYQSAATNTGDQSAATNTGNWSAATNTGNWSAATNTGNRSAATNTGYQSAATNTGDQSAATNTGNWSAATNTGNWSAATNTGNRSAATNTGDQSAATNTGNWSAAIVEGKESIALATGIDSKAKGKIGCFIVLAEWKEIDNEYHIVDVKSAKVDGKNIKEDTFYTLKDGKFVEVG
jgi:hypothetical protein